MLSTLNVTTSSSYKLFHIPSKPYVVYTGHCGMYVYFKRHADLIKKTQHVSTRIPIAQFAQMQI